ncbi:hypothetical protein ACFE04_001784 [Oxalis oulophora]
MASLQASNFLVSSCYSSNRIKATLSIPKIPRISFSNAKLPITKDGLVKELALTNGVTSTSPLKNDVKATEQLYAILEAVADRIEMHKNIGSQRESWNNLLLNSVNMITLTATTITAIASCNAAGNSVLALKLASALLFSAATGFSLIMKEIQPSQLAEEQRKATRTFKQLEFQIKTILARRKPTQDDVDELMEKVLALDKAYPLPLLGAMLEKYPESFEPAVWWPKKSTGRKEKKFNGRMNEELEMEMREIVQVLKRKDQQEYKRLGNLVLKVHKTLSIAGPLLTGIAAASSMLIGNWQWAAMVTLVAGALASAVNSLEHGGQVGMVFEMYRNSAGFFNLMEESIESELDIGEASEMKVALQLGRSPSQLRDLAKKSARCREQGVEVDEFASKLF